MINNFFEPHVLQMFKQQQTLWQPLINVVRTEQQEEQDPFMISSIGCTISNNNQPNNNRINQIHYFVVTNLADVHFFAKISDQELDLLLLQECLEIFFVHVYKINIEQLVVQLFQKQVMFMPVSFVCRNLPHRPLYYSRFNLRWATMI
jgi:hypothetical protein